MNDYINYIKNDPYFRSYHHSELTFSMVYAYSEKFMLPYSHDEVVHGKATMIGKMPGSREQKFANLRLTYAYMLCHPGKKLLFMGQDLGEFDEWNENRIVEWELEQVPEHAGIQKLVADLNNMYKEYPELYILDDSPAGFQWINQISANDCYLTFLRKGIRKEQVLLVAANFSGIEKEITTGVPYAGKYKEILNTDDKKYGGSGIVNGRVKPSKKIEWDDRENSITVKLAPLSVSILKYVPAEWKKTSPAPPVPEFPLPPVPYPVFVFQPVQNHADSRFMQFVDKIHEVLRGTVSCRGRIIPNHLIPPGAVKGMLHHGHQLHMGISHFLHIGNQVCGYFPVICIKAVSPAADKGTKIQFVDADWHFTLLIMLSFL